MRVKRSSLPIRSPQHLCKTLQMASSVLLSAALTLSHPNLSKPFSTMPNPHSTHLSSRPTFPITPMVLTISVTPIPPSTLERLSMPPSTTPTDSGNTHQHPTKSALQRTPRAASLVSPTPAPRSSSWVILLSALTTPRSLVLRTPTAMADTSSLAPLLFQHSHSKLDLHIMLPSLLP